MTALGGLVSSAVVCYCTDAVSLDQNKYATQQNIEYKTVTVEFSKNLCILASSATADVVFLDQ